jgi:hypothetical protein
MTKDALLDFKSGKLMAIVNGNTSRVSLGGHTNVSRLGQDDENLAYCRCAYFLVDSKQVTCNNGVPKNITTQQHGHGRQAARHPQDQHGHPKEFRKGLVVALGGVPFRLGITGHPKRTRVQPQGTIDAGRKRKLQPRQQRRHDVPGKGLQDLLVTALDAIKSASIFGGALCDKQ